jgi:hypothetical protein
MSVSENIFCCNLFNEEKHSCVQKNSSFIQPWMINLAGTVKQSGKVYAKDRTIFHKRKTCDLYGNPGTDTNELQKVEQKLSSIP